VKLFKHFYAQITSLFVFIIYLTTMASTVIHLDAGELAAVQSTLGIAHPTGYPLFTLVGFLFTKILFPFRQINVLNLLAAIYCALAVWVFIKLIYLILNNLPSQSEKTKENISFNLDEKQKLLVASTVGLIIGLSKTFWTQSTSVEVYSLHLLLISLILFFTVTAFLSGLRKHWYFVAVFLALGFSNHMTTILLIPGIAFLFFKQNGIKKESFLLIIKMLIIFFPILLVFYSYLPLRAIQEPTINWGNPIDLERILRHVSGKQYQVWIFSSFDAAKKQFIYFINSLPLEFGYIGLVIALVGIPLFIKHSKTIGIFFLVNFVSAVSYSINYDIADIDSYFLLAFVSLALFSIFGIIFILHKIPYKFSVIVILIPLIMLTINYGNVTKRGNYVFEDYTKSILNDVDENSIVFSYLWDYFVSPSYYFQYVENYRDDVVVIDKELLRRSWYYNQLENDFPNVMKQVNPEVSAFLEAVNPFEQDEPFNSQFIEQRYRELMTALVSANIRERNFYITPELFQNEMQTGAFQLPAGFTIVPMQYVFEVVKNDGKYVPAEFNGKIRFTDNPGYYESNIKNFVASMIVYRTMYELQYNNLNKAKALYKKVRTEFPDYRVPQNLVEQFGSN